MGKSKPLICTPYFFLLSLCSAFMVGTGLRMIIDGYFNKKIYIVNYFDLFFDWSMLIALGICLFVFSMYKALKQNNSKDVKDVMV